MNRTAMTEVAQAKTPVCQPVYQTGFQGGKIEFGRSLVNSETGVNNSIGGVASFISIVAIITW